MLSLSERCASTQCRFFADTFWTNPQYAVEVIDPDEDDDDNTGTLIIALMQKERRKKRQEGLELLTIGYLIYKVRLKSASYTR
jgi:calpain